MNEITTLEDDMEVEDDHLLLRRKIRVLDTSCSSVVRQNATKDLLNLDVRYRCSLFISHPLLEADTQVASVMVTIDDVHSLLTVTDDNLCGLEEIFKASARTPSQVQSFAMQMLAQIR